MLARLSAAYFQIVLGRPVLVLLVLVLILGVFSTYIDDFRLDFSADSLLLESDEDLHIFREVSKRYATKDFVFVTFESKEDLFSESSLTTIKSLHEDLAKLDRVQSVLSLINVPLVKVVDGTLFEVAKNWRTLEDEGVDPERARLELRESPIFSNLILSADGQTTALQVNLKSDERYNYLQQQRTRLLEKRREGALKDGEEQHLQQILSEYETAKDLLNTSNRRNIAEIRAIIAKYQDAGNLRLGGVPMISDDMLTFIKSDLTVFGWGVFAFLVGMLSVIFRRLRWVVLPLLSCAFAGTLMVGMLGLVGWPVTVISSNFISLMLIITMSMNVHLVVRYRQLRRDFPEDSQRETVFKTTRKMVWPCLYTALTTIMAFASLVVSGIKPVIDFGWMMTIGLTVTFFTSFLLFPAALVLLEPIASNDSERSQFQFTSLLSGITERHGDKVLIAAVLFALISFYGISKLEVENSFINYFSEDTEIYQGLKLIDEKLGGTTPLEIILKFHEEEQEEDFYEDEDPEFAELFGEVESEETSNAWFTPDKIDLIKAIHDYVESLPAVGKVLSLASILRVAEDLNKGEEFDTFQLGIINKRLPDELRDAMLTPFISIDDNEARISMRILDSLPDLRRKEFLDEINSTLRDNFSLGPDDVQVTGLLVLYNNVLQSLFRSQILTLGVVMLGIAIMLMVLFRSVSLAVIGIIPNLLAASMILGLMGIMQIPLDMMTITIAAITIGIAVDNSIHYIYRYREEFARSGDYVETLHYCHANIGKAVFYTAITIITGFSILVFSNFKPTIYFGLLTALAMAIALFAALTLLPKLILVWKPFRSK